METQQHGETIHQSHTRESTSEDFNRWVPPGGRNYKKKTPDLEIVSRGVLRTSRRAQRGELPRITIIFLYSQCHPTPSELRDRSIWRLRGEFCWNFTPDQVCDRPWDDQFQLKNMGTFIRYLGAQWTVWVHSYSTVSKYSLVLSNYQVSAPSDH